MSRLTLFQLTFRRRQMVDHGYIEASSIEKAEELGRQYCATNSHKYVSVRDAVLIREPEVKPLVK